LAVCATDGFALALASIACPQKVPKGVIVPLKTINELARVKAPVVLRFDDRVFEFRTKDHVFTSKLIGATYPDYARVIPPTSGNTAELDRAALVAGLERLSAVAKADGRIGVAWNGDGGVALCIPETDNAEDVIEATTTGQLQIAF
jgi:DNA polymerase-3 subunit beta